MLEGISKTSGSSTNLPLSLSVIPFNKGGSETDTGTQILFIEYKIGRLFSAADDKRLKRHEVQSQERKSNLENGLKTINCSVKKGKGDFSPFMEL